MRSLSPTWRIIATVAVLATLTASCSESSNPPTSLKPAVSTTEAAPTTVIAETSTTLASQDGGTVWQQALDGKFAGARVKLALAAGGLDEERYLEMADRLSALTGMSIEVDLPRSRDMLFTSLMIDDAVPDIAALTASGAREVAAYRDPIDVRSALGGPWLAEQYSTEWLDAATLSIGEGEIMAGVWHTYQMGNVVFYPADDFAATSYAIPETWTELVSLSEVIVADGGTPWCIGVEAGDYTGWMITRWLEEILLRTVPIEYHALWTQGQLEFDSPQVAGALDLLSEIWLRPGFVAGGRAAITRIEITESPLPMFDDPPGCWFHFQSPWISESFPDTAVYGRDYGFFLVPPVDEQRGTPMPVDGTIMVMLDDRPEVRAAMAYLAQAESAAEWVAEDIALSPHLGTTLNAYPSEFSRDLAIAMAEVDMLPPTVTQVSGITANEADTRQLLTEYVDGQREARDVLAFIDNPLLAPPPPPPAPPKSGHVVDLIAEGAIKATSRGAGIDDLDLDLENLLDELLEVEIPPGTYFVAGSGGVQNMVVRTGKTIELKPNQLLKTVLDVACSNLERDIPGDDDKFNVQRQSSDSMTRLMQVLDDSNARYDVAQAATWIVSDNADYGDLGILITSPSRARVIDEADAGLAMQLVDEAGIDIKGRRIWRDRDTIADGADEGFKEWIAGR